MDAESASGESDFIDDNEKLVRLIWKDFFKDGRPRLRGFQPNRGDTDGLSVFRMKCLAQPTDALNAVNNPDKRDSYAIVEITAKDIRAAGFSLMSSPTKVPGHCVIPELTQASWDLDQNNLKAKLDSIVAEASVIREPLNP